MGSAGEGISEAAMSGATAAEAVHAGAHPLQQAEAERHTAGRKEGVTASLSAASGADSPAVCADPGVHGASPAATGANSAAPYFGSAAVACISQQQAQGGKDQHRDQWQAVKEHAWNDVSGKSQEGKGASMMAACELSDHR